MRCQVPELRAHKPAKELSEAEKLASARHEMEIACAHLARERKRVSKAEQKIQKLTTGYQKRAGALCKEASKVLDEAEATVVEQSTYALMCEYEAAALPKRLAVRDVPFTRVVVKHAAVCMRFLLLVLY